MKGLTFLLSRKHEDVAGYILAYGGIVSFDMERKYDCVVFPPGCDVSPFLYGEKRLPCTIPGGWEQDMQDNYVYRRIPLDVPKIGLGRGAHFLNIAAGGRMYQHVDGHAVNHYIYDFLNNKKVFVTSNHIQEMILPSDAYWIACASVSSKKETPDEVIHVDYSENYNKGHFNDIEIAWIEQNNSLLFQPTIVKNPGYQAQHNTNAYLQEMFKEWLLPSIGKKEV